MTTASGVSIPLITGLITDKAKAMARQAELVSIPLITGLITDKACAVVGVPDQESQSL